jgi:MFS family permease
MNTFKLSEADRKRSLRASIIDGIFASVTFGVTNNFVVPFAVAFHASSAFIGWLSSLPNLVSALSQLKSADFTERVGSRLRTMEWCVYLQATTAVLIALLAFGAPAIGQAATETSYLVLICLFVLFGAFSFPQWSSLMSDTVKPEEYGRYFAWRSAIIGGLMIVVGYASAFFLDHAPIARFLPGAYAGFAVLFAAAGISRYFSGYYVGRMVDVPIAIPAAEANPQTFGVRFTYWQFLKRYKESNFVKFVVFTAAMNFAICVWGPFSTVYMLQELHMTYTQYTMVVLAASMAGLVSLPFWGRYADRIGNAKIIKITTLFFPVFTVGFMLTTNLYLIVLLNAFVGYIWTGFNLASGNFIYDVATPAKRTRCVAYYGVTNGIAVCLGCLAGGYLLPHLPPLTIGVTSRILTLMLISAILRATVLVFFVNSFREVRAATPMEEHRLFFTIIGVQPGLDLIREFVNERVSRKKQP